MSDLVPVIWSYVVLQLLAVAAWPWLLIVLRGRETRRASSPPSNQTAPDLALPLAKSLGLVLVSYATWLIGFSGIPIVAPVVWFVWVALGAAGYAALGMRPAELIDLARRHRRAILVGEAVFLAVFLSLCRVRALSPDATFRYDERGRDYDGSASEKFTNLALLNSLSRERHLPPRDTWLAGYPINYYYFGHFEWATFGRMAFIPPRIGFNIGQAAVFALIAANAFSLALGLTRRLGAGLLAAYAVPIMGSPYGFVQLLLQGVRNYQFWDASRIVEGTIVNGQIAGPITEFPFFTFVVGDFHAHGISFHSYLLALAIALLFPFHPVAARGASEPNAGRHSAFATAAAAFFLALLLAVTAMANTWDAPSLGLLVATILLLRSFECHGLSWGRTIRPLALAASVAVGAAVLLIPHLKTFALPVGITRDPTAFYIFGPVKWLGTTHLSEFKDYMVHFGFLLVPLTLAIHARLIARARGREEPRRRVWANVLALSYVVALYVFLFAQRYFLLFFLTEMVACAVALAIVELQRARTSGEPEERQWNHVFATVGALSAIAFLLSLFAEVWVVDDGYEGPFERYNTVFKIYNVVWLLYGVSFAASIAWLLRRRQAGCQPAPLWFFPQHQAGCQPAPLSRVIVPWAGLILVLAMGAVYPVAATLARARELEGRVQFRDRVALPQGPALDAVRYYASVNRSEYRLIEWIAETIRDKPVVAEGCRAGDSYTLQGRIATFTGLRTVVAWPQHEANWRGLVASSRDPGRPIPVWQEMSRRMADLAALYTSQNDGLVREIIERYRIDYVLVGRWERALYGPETGQHLRRMLTAAFEDNDVALLNTARGDAK